MQSDAAAPLSPRRQRNQQYVQHQQQVGTPPPQQQIADDHLQITIMQEQAQILQCSGIGVGALCILFAVILFVKNLMGGSAPTKKPKARAASA
jgi:hypothetical protein